MASVERVPPGSLAPVRAGAFSCLPPAATAVEAATANEQDDQNDDQQGRGVHVALPRCALRAQDCARGVGRESSAEGVTRASAKTDEAAD